ncbi:MAG: carbohydrate binding domain-containing protein [Panacagrimonas sp.]
MKNRVSGEFRPLISFLRLAILCGPFLVAAQAEAVSIEQGSGGRSSEVKFREKSSLAEDAARALWLKGLSDAEFAQEKPLSANPYLANLPEGVVPDYTYWREAMRRKAAKQEDSLDALIATGESEPNDTIATANPVTGFGTGSGDDPIASVTGALTPAGDVDFYSVQLDAGDILGVSSGSAGADIVEIRDPSGLLMMGSAQNISSLFPPGSPLPSSGTALADVVAPVAGTYTVAFRRASGTAASYIGQLRVFRPVLESGPLGSKQVLFLDFDGATIDANALFGGGNNPATLSPLSAFLADWSLAGQENALIDAIIAVVQENLRDDLLAIGLNPTTDIDIRNSRDHADPVGLPNVSRVVIGGTVAESGIQTFGIASAIDPGNFGTTDTALALLDLFSAPASNPNSINSLVLANPGLKLQAVARVVGYTTSHEAAHFFGLYHTSNTSPVSTVIDAGGDAGGINRRAGVGPDGIFGTADDIDVGLLPDEFFADEGFTGTEDETNATAFGLSTPADALTAGAAVYTQVIGDGDSAIEPNETWSISLPLTKRGPSTATAVNATLSMTSGDVSLLGNTSAYPNIAPDASQSNTTAFSFRVESSFPCGGAIEFSALVSYTGGRTSSQIFGFSTPTGGIGAPSTFTYAGSPVAIPDGTGLNTPGAAADASLVVSGLTNFIKDVNLRIDGSACSTIEGSTTVGLDHNFVGDLGVSLVSPGGQVINLMSRPGTGANSGNNFCQTVLDDESAGSSIQGIISTGAPYTGSFTPASPLSGFDEGNPNGTWALRAQDFAAADTGSIRAFSLILTPTVCNAPVPTPAPTVTITANPTTITLDASSTLTWSSTNATACTASGAWTGARATSGTESVTPAATGNAAYTLTCTGPGDSGNATANVTVNAVPTPEPTVMIAANPTTITLGASSTLTWSSTNATSCTASGAWTGARGTSGMESVTPAATGNASYTLTCTGPGGSGNATAMIAVNPVATPAPTVTIAASPTSITLGASSTLTWSSTNATACTASGAWTGARATSGTQSVTPAATGNASYTLTCTGTGSGNATAMVAVNPVVVPVPPPPAAANLVQNPGFETGSLSPWYFFAVGNALGTASVDSTIRFEGTRSGRVTITRVDLAAPWNATLAQQFNLVAGTTYTLKFRAMADRNRSIRALVQLPNAPFTSYIDQTLALNTGWQEFSYTFTPTVSARVALSLNMGQALGNVWIDAVSLAQLVLPPPPPAPTPVSLIQNPGFENGTLAPWYFFAVGNAQGNATSDTSQKFEGNRSGRVNITRADAAAPWNATLAQGVSLVAGRTYTLRFRAMADRNRSIRALVQRNVSPFTSYFNQQIALNNGWQTFSFTFTAPVSTPAILAFNLGESQGSVWFDAVTLQ